MDEIRDLLMLYDGMDVSGDTIRNLIERNKVQVEIVTKKGSIQARSEYIKNTVIYHGNVTQWDDKSYSITFIEKEG